MLKRFAAGYTSLALLVGLAAPTQAGAASIPEQSDSKEAPKEIIVKYKEGVSSTEKSSLISKLDDSLKEKYSAFSVVTVTDGSVAEAVKEYEANPNVEYAEPNVTYKASYVPNDPDYSTKQYAPQKVGAEAAWDVTRGSSTVKIAVVDTGVDYNHPDLAGKVIKGKDFVTDDNDPMDENKHGTHVAGIAAASTNNGVGMAGLAPNVQILAERVLDADGSGTLDDVAAGIRHAADSGAQVINLSLGGAVGTKTLEDAVNYAASKGSVVVAAAGNESTPLPSYPAYYDKAIAVAATDQNDKIAYFSNYGPWVDVAAPGVSLYSTVPGGKYENLSGTSMASPVVAGVAGLLASQGKNATQIRTALEGTADKVTGSGTLFKHGRINAAKAVTQ
ncbi:S8 family peptidase [Fictibacillus iocasae]|uniref:S8 family peptidase n=1 Tax=Fictibacillus iocasae TaxID=2715437 RepID=A0ABW2NNS9_9BACL